MLPFSINFFDKVDAISHEIHFNLAENLGKRNKFHRKIHEKQSKVS